MADKTSIVFFGTPEFAVPSLEILFKNNFRILCVVTVPDKPAGRGQKIMTSPVKDFASANGLPLLQPVRDALEQVVLVGAVLERLG